MNNNPFSLEEKNIIITGASSGIGRQCAIACSEQGARIILIGRDEKRLLETKSNLKNGPEHIHISLDITDFVKLKDSLKELAKSAGKIHGLVNAAGISPTIPFRMLSPEKMEETFKVNVTASMQISKEVCKPDIACENGMSIIFIPSVMSEAGESGKSLYAMSKAAVVAGARALSIEYAAKKIRFNSISPGVVVTLMSMNSVYSKNEVALKSITDLHPLGLGKPEDIANAAVYLLSDASGWVTGTNMIVDGGYLAR